MDDVILAHKPRQLNVAAQLIEAQLTCSLGFGYAMNGPLRTNVLTLTGLLLVPAVRALHIMSLCI